jgi:hypothetical protein
MRRAVTFARPQDKAASGTGEPPGKGSRVTARFAEAATVIGERWAQGGVACGSRSLGSFCW